MFLKFAGIGATIGAGLTAAAQGLLSIIGFTSSGIAAGSFAAGVQGAAVASGSLFSILQSVGAGATLLSTTVMAPMAAVGAAVGTLFLFLRKRKQQKP